MKIVIDTDKKIGEIEAESRWLRLFWGNGFSVLISEETDGTLSIGENTGTKYLSAERSDDDTEISIECVTP